MFVWDGALSHDIQITGLTGEAVHGALHPMLGSVKYEDQVMCNHPPTKTKPQTEKAQPPTTNHHDETGSCDEETVEDAFRSDQHSPPQNTSKRFKKHIYAGEWQPPLPPPVMVMVPLTPLWLWCGAMVVVVVDVIEEVEVVRSSS